MSYDIDNVN